MRKLNKIAAKWTVGLVVFAGIVALQGTDRVAEAQEQDIELEDEEIASMEEGPTVRHKLLHRSGRLEVAPSASFSLNDAFIRNAVPGIELSYFLNNEFGISASFGYSALQFDTSLRENLDATLGDDALAETSLSRIGWTMDAGLVYVPAFGKFTLMNSSTVHYDFHFFGGLGVISETAVSASGDGTVDPEMSGVRPGGMFGAGLRFFLTDRISLDLRARNYLMARSQAVSQGGADLQLQNTMMFSTGIGIFWPGEVKMSQ